MQTTPADEASSVPVDTTPKKTLREIVLEAQQEIRNTITDHRLKTSQLLADLADIGGVEKYDDVVLAFVNEAGDKGVHVSKLHAVLPDSVALTKARNDLVKAGKIKAEKDGVTFLLTPFKGTPVEA